MGSRYVRVLRYLKLVERLGWTLLPAWFPRGPHSELGNKAPLGLNWVWMSEKQEQPSALKAGSLHPGWTSSSALHLGRR